MDNSTHNKHYIHLIIMMVLSFVSMFVLMYAMVDSFANVYLNLNQLYMVGLMIIPMVIIELFVMKAMYANKKINILVITLSIITFIGLWIGMRQQIGISDKQFLKSMIPHHAGAILMCEKAILLDPELKELCKDILSGQQAEIDFMKVKLSKLK